MRPRATPPADISPRDFFLHWLPESVSRDRKRRARLGRDRASLCFDLRGEGGGRFTVYLDHGSLRSTPGGSEEPADLSIRLDVDTWRKLNSGELAAPRALLGGHLELSGNLRLAAKLYAILR